MCIRSPWLSWLILASFTLAASVAGFAHARSGAPDPPATQQAHGAHGSDGEGSGDAEHAPQRCIGCLIAEALRPAGPDSERRVARAPDLAAPQPTSPEPRRGWRTALSRGPPAGHLLA